MREQVEESEEQFENLGENNSKFLVPIPKDNEYDKTIENKIKFIDGVIFMVSSLSRVAKNLANEFM